MHLTVTSEGLATTISKATSKRQSGDKEEKEQESLEHTQ